jgi:hypothetical protein
VSRAAPMACRLPIGSWNLHKQLNNKRADQHGLVLTGIRC